MNSSIDRILILNGQPLRTRMKKELAGKENKRQKLMKTENNEYISIFVIHKLLNICVRIHTYNTHTHIDAYKQTQINTCLQHTHTYTHAYTHTYLDIHIHTYIYTHIQTAQLARPIKYTKRISADE